ncbi:dUTP diphosphatase [Bacteroidota bacterium]
MQTRIVNKSRNPVPKYQSVSAAGSDLHANLKEHITLKPLERILVPTGLFIELPLGFEAQIRPRSGMALKYGITVLNTPGTIDSDYRGEIMVLLINLSNKSVVINNGDRIAQMVIAKYESVEWETVESISETDRQSGGFGSTGHS